MCTATVLVSAGCPQTAALISVLARHLAAATDQVGQQLQFTCGELHLAVVESYLVTAEVDHDRTDGHDTGGTRSQVALVGAQAKTQDGVEVIRSGHRGVGARLERCAGQHLVAGVAPTRMHIFHR